MKIASVRAQIVLLPADEPLADGKGIPGMTRSFVVVKLATKDGVEGLGVTFFGAGLNGALKTAVEDLGKLTIGEDPHRVEAIVAKLHGAAGRGTSGPGGIFMLALSAIDMALWDIRGKLLGVSVAKLLGGFREKVPAYASGALMRTQSVEDCARAAGVLVERGWKSMKTQLAIPGDTTPAKEVERIRVIREIIGPDVQLMCDINQRWGVHEAISIGERLTPYHLHWLEDVTTADDYQGIARIAGKIPTPIAAGEYVWGIAPFRQLLEARAIEYVMIDLMRVGGITQWFKVAGMAEAFNLPVVSHLIPEVHVHLIAAIPNGHVVEYMPWTSALFQDPPIPKQGEMTVPTGAGLGLEFTQKVNDGFGKKG